MHERELELRQQRFAQLRAVLRAHDSEGAQAEREQLRSRREEGAAAARRAVERFLADRDVDALTSGLAAVLDVAGGAVVWPGPHRAAVSFLEHLQELSGDQTELAALLADVVAVPEGDGSAEVARLVEHVQVVRQGARPSARHAVTLLSLCWWLQAPADWPVLWAPVEEAMRTLGWLRGDESPVELYAAYRSTVLALGEPSVVEDTLGWFTGAPWSGLDRAIPERLSWARQLYDARVDHEYLAGQEHVARTNIDAVLAELRRLGDDLVDDLSEAIGRQLRRQVAGTTFVPGVVRTNGWVKWKPGGGDATGWHMVPHISLAVVESGLLIGFHPGVREAGWTAFVRDRLADAVPDGLELLSTRELNQRGDPDLSGSGAFMIGRWYPDDQMLGTRGLRDEVVRIAVAAQPVFDRTMQLATRWPEPAPVVEEADEPTPGIDDPLRSEVERFVEATGYPTEADTAQSQARAAMAAHLDQELLEEVDLNEIGRICNSGRYGSTGFTNPVRRAIAGAGPDEDARIRAMVRHLLWGDGPVEQRLADCLDNSRFGVPGFGEAPLLKLLAVVHPEQFLPLYRLRGERGKVALLESLELAVPDARLPRATRHVQANDTLRGRLAPFFPGDPWGQAAFAAWYHQQRAVPPEDLETRLDDVVNTCLLPSRKFVDEVVALLEDKRQVVLYGPPGTGKTYIARHLAAALAPDPELRRLVQFHPSTSYEDFFEGYRPAADASGNLSYSLQQGPFAQLADHAAEDSRIHVLIIDELNRANVPKVLGELLFLLEYRDETVIPLYRPDGFQLPENLWVIATMNTADRSIASIDAALRRRFHFVGVFPDEEPVQGLLARFLSTVGADRQWADLVDMVNADLRKQLGNGDLLIGPSHFMKRDLDEALMDRIWRYDIEPFLEDQFFGDRDLIERFRWPRVLARHRQQAEPVPTGGDDGPDGNAAPGEGESGSAAATDEPDGPAAADEPSGPGTPP